MDSFFAAVCFVSSVGVALLFFIARKVNALVGEERRIRVDVEKLVATKA